MKTTGKVSLQRSFRLIQGIVGLLLLFLVLQGWVMWRVCDQGVAAIQGLEKEGLPSLRHLASLQENLAIYRLRSYELMFAQETDRPAKSKATDEVHAKNLEILQKLQQLFPAGEGRQHVDSLQAGLLDYVQAMDRIRGLVEKDFPAAMKILDQEVPPKVQSLNAAAEQVKTHCSDAAAQRTKLTVSSFGQIRQNVFTFGSLSISFAILAVVLVTISSSRVRRAIGELVQILEDDAHRLTQATTTVASTSQSLADGASKQAASLEETSASLEEMASMTKRNAENSSNGANLGRQARESATAGLERINELSRTLDLIKSAVAEMQTAVTEMQTSSQQVSKIIKTIDEIAFQTNLLALNAAVEAARAGEAGMGFAVVADEVRALAQRSAQAAKDTASKIEDAVKRSELGAVASTKVVKSLTEVETTAASINQVFTGIVAQIKSLDEVIAEIAAASKEQSQGIGEVNMAVSQMDKVTQSNAAHAEETAAAAEELHNEVGSMRDVVTQLETVVSGQRAATIQHAPPAPRPASGGKRHQPAAKKPATKPAALPDDRDIPMPEPVGSGGGFTDF